VLDNVSGVLKSESLSLGDVLKTTIFLTDLGNFQIVNEILRLLFQQSAASSLNRAGFGPAERSES
jgi:2-iminobutanoate/2-iminopropanoate deaminase